MEGLELVPDIGDNWRACLTAWDEAYWLAIESGIGRGVLPAPSRVQDYHQGRKLAGRGFYFPIEGLERVKAWMAQLVRPDQVGVIPARG